MANLPHHHLTLHPPVIDIEEEEAETSTVEEEEVEVSTVRLRPLRDPQIHKWIMYFEGAVGKSFDPKFLGLALVIAVK